MDKKQHDNVECGERLRKCREEMGLTQQQLAEAVYKLKDNRGKERSTNQIGYMERGIRSISYEYAALLSQVLGVRAEYLLGIDDYKNTANQLVNAINDVNHEGYLLYTGTSAFGELAGYSITIPNIYSGGKTFSELFAELKSGCKIFNEDEIVILSANEMIQFENEIFDFVELKFKHLFKQKGEKK